MEDKDKFDKYLIQTLEQLVGAKTEATALSERVATLQDAANEHDRLSALKEEQSDKLRDRIAKLEIDKMQMQNANAALQLAVKDRDALHGSLEMFRADASTQRERANALGQLVRELDEEKKALTRKLQAAAQVVRVDVGVNTDPLPSLRSTPNNAILPVARGQPTAGPSRVHNLKEEGNTKADTSTGHHPSQLPPTRKKAIEEAPQIIPDLANGEITNFTRPFLTMHLGGGSQSLIVSIAMQKPLAVKFGITSYLCPNLWENPWCPTSPGEAGYMFVGLGEEIHRFVKPEVHELFVGLAKTKYILMGRYEAHRVEPLTVDEWLTLPEKVRSKYCETTQRKSKDSRSVEGLSAAYEAGELRAPCVKLTCLDFKEDLYKQLKAQKTGQHNVSSASSRRSFKQEFPVTRSSQKRRRIEVINIDEFMDTDSDHSV
ncbi:hypothetical protein DEU56DRAFT_486734 [Suillus clintonianus]|uniref:uncharacterized protein n=1 Tax=Suillus clintonianus TaxID=1904413 RepID=UPI001B85D63F|nr:uncharacterized protein DEU56DRAFT_486734 [Suillus clintonianus]KAG2129886.1 hypothetical protein DEU56DRAFT_486734 [Suillus clintonianus]